MWGAMFQDARETFPDSIYEASSRSCSCAGIDSAHFIRQYEYTA
jgi:hypothetical protein